MNIVMFYDQLELALKTNDILARATSRADLGVSIRLKPWRLDLVLHPVMANQISLDAAHAHLIVLAIRLNHELPAWLLNWLENWAAHRQIPEAALALSNPIDKDAISSNPTPGLSALAKRHGLGFIFGQLNFPEKDAADDQLLHDLRAREIAHTRILQSIFAQPMPRYTRNWGLND